MSTHTEVREAQAAAAAAEIAREAAPRPPAANLPRGWPKVPNLADPATYLPEGAALLAAQHAYFRDRVSPQGAGDPAYFGLTAAARFGLDPTWPRPRDADLGWYHLTAAAWVGYDPDHPGVVDPHGVAAGRPLGLVLVGWVAPPVPRRGLRHPRVVSVLAPVCPEAGVARPPLWRHLTAECRPRAGRHHRFDQAAEAAWLAVSLVLGHRLARYATGKLPPGRPTHLRAPDLGAAISAPAGPDGVVPPPAVYPVDAVPVEAMQAAESEVRLVFLPGALAGPAPAGWGVVQRQASQVDIKLTEHVRIQYHLSR